MRDIDSARTQRFNAAETRFQGRYTGKMLDTLAQAYRPYLGRTLLLLLLGFLGRLCLLSNANLIGYWVDSYCQAPAAEAGSCRPVPEFFAGWAPADFLQALLVLTGVGFFLTIVFRVWLSRLSVDAVSSIYDETTFRTSRLPMSFFDQNPAGRVITRFSSDYSGLFRVFGGPIAEFISLVFDLLAMTVLLALAGPVFLPIWVGFAALNFWVYRAHLPSLRKERRESALKRSPGIAHFAESAQGAHTIRAFDKQRTFTERFDQLNDAYLDQRLKATSAFSRFALAMGSVNAVAFLATGLLSVWLVRSGSLSVGAVGVAFTYLGLSTSTLQSFFDWLGQFEEALTGLERMNEYLRLPIEQGAALPGRARFETGHSRERGAQAASAPSAWDGSAEAQFARVEIEDLWMRYREDLPWVLQGVNLVIEPGERLAVVGKTGSGKTSLVQALFRLYPIERGRVHVDGKSAEALGLEAYRSRMSYITQEPTLFLGTLRENLLAGAPSREADSRIIGALRRVQFLRESATDEEYRYWLDYRIEERGRNLSAGERQLVCMARCLLQDSPLVILDEATSAVDPRSEEILTRATEEVFSGKTQIIIAHRLSTVRSCDRVLWLQNGMVRRIGRPDEVLSEFERAELEL
jgi:ABC-type multidrug transport system fused ATPase/permease subunit